ncbi:probable E3 ubiquitin-protein ligase XERICO [Selaginella moellendorffii]|uniref:probable E3 ubiquitin-protein ligase XERICO n=1 Tax=Selaginella moellendorffii TaxID=88036 RepID=UPI000D1C5A12|nr:probable E3 ubiquitin-protein ligase XERICO [Selaginella moellendorffii]|eukprot:XP_024520529.1 probable E3 ubiquitin-protein ligase XERICO [Selaginella moellendorffii]
MGFPSIYGGLLPLVVVNTAISLALVKNLLDSLLRIVGLKRDSSEVHQMEPSRQPRRPVASSLSPDRSQPQHHHHSFVEEIQSSLPLIEFSKLVHSSLDISEIPSSSLDNPGEIPPSPSSSSSPPSSLEFPGENEEHEAQCAVCLCDFEPSSLVRKLPNCSHVFHRDCLDKWLNHNHTTCPMCRSSLLTLDLAKKHRQQEEILAEELALWLSVYHTSGLARGPWWYRGHGSGFATGWDFH